MPSEDALVAELETLRERLEDQWCLPWYADRQPDPVWRQEVVQSVEQLADDRLDAVLTGLFRRTSFALLGVALHLVARRRRSGFLEPVRDALMHGSLHVRALAAVAIGRLRDLEGLDLLLDTKDTEHPEVKKAIVDALRTMRDTRSIPLLARWVGRVGEDDELRRKACQALGSIGDDAAMPVLARVMEDDTVADEVRGDAARAVGCIGGTEGRELLLSGFERGRKGVPVFCAEALGFFGDRSLVARIAKVIPGDGPVALRRAALDAVARLGGHDAVRSVEAALEDAEAGLRAVACEALVSLAGPRAATRLAARFEDEDESVCEAAVRSYGVAVGEDFGIQSGEAVELALARARAHAESAQAEA